MQSYSIAYTSSVDTADIITTADLKAHLRVDHSDEDTFIEALRDAAVEYAESYCNVKLGDRTAVYYTDAFPNYMEIPVGPVQAISGITYNTDRDTTATLDTSYYYYELVRQPARISFISPPSVEEYTHNGVQIACTIGYPEADIPKAIKHAIRLMVGHWYENRRQVVMAKPEELPMGIHSLLNPFRIISEA